MEHELKLQPNFFNYVKYGTKRIELRLYDEKRQKINIGDTIIFRKEPELTEMIEAKVIGLLRYASLLLQIYLKILILTFWLINQWRNKNYYLHLINFILWKSKGNME